MKKGLSKTYRERLLLQACEQDNLKQFKNLYNPHLSFSCYSNCLQVCLLKTRNFEIATMILEKTTFNYEQILQRCCFIVCSFDKELIIFLSFYMQPTSTQFIMGLLRNELALHKPHLYYKTVCFLLKKGFTPISMRMSECLQNFNCEYFIGIRYSKMIEMYSLLI